jgi:parallel beta-helix repeat protein
MQNRLAALAFAACSTIAAPAFAETTECTVISTLPATISTPGIYCLKSDLMTGITSGNAITINSNYVTVDLNGWRLGGGAAGMGTQATGIYANDRRGVTIKNGSIKGFHWGIYLAGSAGTTNVVEGIRADGNTAAGILIDGTDSIIRNNQVTNTGGSTLGSNDQAWGIGGNGIGHRILNNDVSGVVATKAGSNAFGITIGGTNLIIAGNRISDVHSTLAGAWGMNGHSEMVIVDNQIVGATGVTEVGIDVVASAVIRNNQITGYTTGVHSTVASTIYSGNVVVGATTPYSGGTAHIGTNAP